MGESQWLRRPAGQFVVTYLCFVKDPELLVRQGMPADAVALQHACVCCEAGKNRQTVCPRDHLGPKKNSLDALFRGRFAEFLATNTALRALAAGRRQSLKARRIAILYPQGPRRA